MHAYVHTHFNIPLTCHLREHTDFCKGAKSPDFTHTLCSYLYFPGSVLTDTRRSTDTYSTYACVHVHDIYV